MFGREELCSPATSNNKKGSKGLKTFQINEYVGRGLETPREKGVPDRPLGGGEGRSYHGCPILEEKPGRRIKESKKH